MKKKVLIFLDRDGTINYDNKYYLGSQRDWKSKIKFLPHVLSGLKVLKKIPNSEIYLITNQSGIAVKEFPLLTKKRAKEVMEYILKQLRKKRIVFDGYEICNYVSFSYVKRRKYFTFNKKLVGNFDCVKPKPGMVKNILRRRKIKRNKAEIYIIGDRLSDVKTALNIKGFGIIVPFMKEKGEEEKVKKLKNKNTFVAKNFLDAAKFIARRELKRN